MKRASVKVNQKQNTNITLSQNGVDKSRKLTAKKDNSIPYSFGLGGLRSPTEIPLTLDNILFLQRTIANQSVCKLLQARLKVGHPRDRYEQEADRVADEVMRMPKAEPAPSVEPAGQERLRQPLEEEMLQRQPLENEQEEGTLRRQVEDNETYPEVDTSQEDSYDSEVREIDSGLETRIQGLRGGGIPLSESERHFFESRIGYDFSGVRVHSDANAADIARSVNARAFTIGRDVVFASGEYAPASSGGRRLLAHELTHVIQQNGTSTYGPSLPTIQRQRDPDDEPSQGFTCGHWEMSQATFDERESCCSNGILDQLDEMRKQSCEAMRTAIQRMSSGAAIDGLLRLHFGESGPSQRSTILNKIRQTLTVAENFPDKHIFLCRTDLPRFGCADPKVVANSDEDTDITVCLLRYGGTLPPEFWESILHEFFHVSGVADLPIYSAAKRAQKKRGEFETFYRPQGEESDDPWIQRYPSAEPLRNADSYANLVATLSKSDWSSEGTVTRFIPGLNLGGGIMFGGGEVEAVVAARSAFITPLGRGLHFIAPGVVGLWMPGLGIVDASDPDAAQPRGYVGGELGLRGITGADSVAGVFDLGAGVGSVFRRDESADIGMLVRTSVGARFGAPDIGVSMNFDLMRMFDFALNEQRKDAWIVGLSFQGHWGGHSGAPR